MTLRDWGIGGIGNLGVGQGISVMVAGMPIFA